MNRKDFFRKKRRNVCARRIAFLLVMAIMILCAAVACGMIGKAALVIDRDDPMLLPVLLTTLGAAGALAKLAEWLSRE